MMNSQNLNIVVEGCCHGELDGIYASIALVEQNQNLKVHLLICCGDFQSLRNTGDFHSLAVPKKYKQMQSFHKYYSGEKVAPVPTIFIGGNHEASNALQELFYGGWVAPNIYYLGRAGCVRFGGLKIAGLSGIYKQRHYNLGHYEKPPYTPDSVRSVYHVREMEVFKLAQIQEAIDIFLSHDWPTNIAHHGDKQQLFRKKDFLQQEVEDGSLGSPPGEYLLKQLKPKYWFAAHLHVKFAAVYTHGQEGEMTRFLSLDKCLPKRDFLQLVAIPRKDNQSGAPLLEFDPEWLAITKKTHGLLSTLPSRVTLPSTTDLVSEEEIEWARNRAQTILCKGHGLKVPENFEVTAPPHTLDGDAKKAEFCFAMVGNPQTDVFLECLELAHKVTVPCSKRELTSESGVKYTIGPDPSTPPGSASLEEKSGNGMQEQKVEQGEQNSSSEEDSSDNDTGGDLGFFIDRGNSESANTSVVVEDPSEINIDDV